VVPRNGGGEVRAFLSCLVHGYVLIVVSDGCRFRRWLLSLATSDGFFIVPPVDVWLIWHTYMLNPMSVPKLPFQSWNLRGLISLVRRWYTEDCERVWFLRPLRDLREHPLDLAVCVLYFFVATDLTDRLQAVMGDDILNYMPTVDQEGVWEAGTRLPFDPFVSSAILADVDIECPKCERQINICMQTPICPSAPVGRAKPELAFVNTEDMGFAQPEFITVCPRCETLVTRESLGVAKFIRDIVLDPNDTSHVQMHGKGVYLA